MLVIEIYPKNFGENSTVSPEIKKKNLIIFYLNSLIIKFLIILTRGNIFLQKKIKNGLNFRANRRNSPDLTLLKRFLLLKNK